MKIQKWQHRAHNHDNRTAQILPPSSRVVLRCADLGGMQAEHLGEHWEMTRVIALDNSQPLVLETAEKEIRGAAKRATECFGRWQGGLPERLVHRFEREPVDGAGLGGAKRPGGRPGQAHSREDVVRLRLGNLMAVLGWLRTRPSSLQAEEQDLSASSLLGEGVCRGAVSLRGRYVPGKAVALGCLVVAARGVVVVDIAPEGRCAEQARAALRHARALRSWLSGTDWSDVPVLAALCSLGRPEVLRPRPVVLDRLWLGPIASLGSWLMGGGPLDIGSCEALGAFLEEHLGQ